MIPQEHRASVNGVDLTWFEWRADLRGTEPSIVMIHATGFHARVWDSVIRRLGDRHVVALDQRGHGRSEKRIIEHWRVLGEDLVAWVELLELEGAIGVGHSMGGHALVEAAARRPEVFRRLLLIDPVIASPGDFKEGGWTIEMPAGWVHPTARRKNRFASPQAMFERFRDRPPYADFVEEALRDYCDYGLLPADDGDGLVLACPPAIEASIYMTSRTNSTIYDSIRALDIPVTILRAKEPSPDRDPMDFSSSPTYPGLVYEFKRGHEVHLRDRTHFIPMESPELVAGYVLGD